MKLAEVSYEETKNSDLILATTDEEYQAAKLIINEYAASLNFSLDFDHIDEELANLKEYYGPPTGAVILVKSGDHFVGSACVRNLGHFIAEIKRMYLKPAYRGHGLGRKLMNKAIDEAKRLGYRYIRLDTVPDMKSAIHLFTSRGFYEIEDYRYNPILGARYLEFKL